MTESVDPALPRDPAEYRPRRRLDPGSWALVALTALGVAATVGVVAFGPTLFPPKPEAVAARPQTLPAEPVAAALETAPAAAALADPSAEIARLNARIADLEGRAQRTGEAAASALAAAALIEATQGSAPFAAELAALRAVAPGLPELPALRGLAEMGAPSRAALAASFADYAARAAVASRMPADGAPLKDRLAYYLSRIVTVRPVGRIEGQSADARLARAEVLLAEGDVSGALAELDGLPPAARAALAPWRTEAERRARIDRAAAALRARALRELSSGGRAA